MTKEQAVSGESSRHEIELQEINRKIAETSNYLMEAFFQDNTWDVRQAGAYGAPLLEIEGDIKNHDWGREEQLVRKIIGDLDSRLRYYEAAYHFPDVLSAFRVSSDSSWLDMMAERSSDPREVVAADLLAKARAHVAKETDKFFSFLESDTFKQAFSIKVDPKTGEYTITDLALDSEELRAKWNELAKC